MFELEYKGANCVVLTSKVATIVVDPKLSLVGLKDIKTNDEIELTTESRFRVENSDARIIIDSPGEYEVGDFTIRGTAASRHVDTLEDEKWSTIYRLECGDVRLAVIGNIDPKLTDEQLESIGVVDILVLPVGGNGYTLDATSAALIVRQIEPKIVVPVHYADSALRYEVPQDNVDLFINELAVPAEEMAKLKVKTVGSIGPSLMVAKVTRS
ncbi:MBL fold metallo-hydrolase [Candidatus Saccharibacteria bacterium]|nr:MAG: MBL fold metallo-hydrolase [Candidatus Saccharibacteria bacterium]